ncbi:MAG TPA: elongation factor G, partial [Dehalococcoidia bacterium]|nr:elongation factor G [Dehalococcoidia bacterium]
QADRYHVPRICFVNKMDRTGADFWRTVEMIRERLDARPVPIQIPIGAEASFAGVVDLVEQKAWYFSDDRDVPPEERPVPAELVDEVAKRREELIEQLAEADEQTMISYVEGHEISPRELKLALRRATLANTVTPVLCGAALRNKGIQPLLDAVVDYLPAPVDVPAVRGTDPRTGESVERRPSDDEPFTALAFKIVADPFVGRLAYFRVYSGTVKTGQTVLNSQRGEKERIGRILKMHANHREEVSEMYAGGIAAAVGLKKTFTGDTLCDPAHPIVLEAIRFPEPVISVAIEPKTKDDQDRMGEALNKLAEEDPTFRTRYDPETGQTLISGMGELHLEIITDRLRREFRVQANVGKPEVAFKETITKPASAEGRFIRQTGGRGQYGVVRLEVAPNERGKGVEIIDKVVGGEIPREFIPAAMQGVRDALETGPLAGYPVLDVIVTITGGDSHPVDSSELAFRTAGAIATRDALERAEPVLLEPIMRVEISTPEEFFGDVLGDLNGRRGHVIGVETRGSLHIVRALVPLAETFGYATDLRSLSQGRATYSMEFDHYEEVPRALAEKLVGARMKSTAGGRAS